MFIGHFAVGFGAKRASLSLSLGVLFAACQFLDLICPLLVLSGIEIVHVDRTATAFSPLAFDYYPFSHSLGMTLLWAIGAAVAAKLLRRTNREAVVIAWS